MFLVIGKSCFKHLFLRQFFELAILCGFILKKGSYSTRNDVKVNILNFVQNCTI